MSNYAFLLADADNTLFDFPAGEKIALRNTFAQFELPVDEATLSTYHSINQALWKKLERGEIQQSQLRLLRFEQFLAQIGQSRDASQLAEAFVVTLGQQAPMLAGAEAAVRRWSARVPIVIVTNGIAAVQRARIARSPISSLMRALIISEEVGAAKPDPRMVEAALTVIGCTDRSQALLLGDSLDADIAAATNAGIASCWFNPEQKPNHSAQRPTHMVSSLDEVDALLL